MSVMFKSLPRRTFLRGASAAVALPLLDAMTPAWAKPAAPPLRLAFVYVPNGIDMAHWNVEQDGALGQLPRLLQPLSPLRDYLLQLGNLTHNSGRPLLDGAGDHARSAATYLTAVPVRKSTTELRAGVSCDQVIANQLAPLTRFPSLELGMDDVRQAGDCDSGYSCAYTNNLAWRSERQPLPPVLDPRLLFERLFGKAEARSSQELERVGRLRTTILDQVRADTQRLHTDLGSQDRLKLEEYLTSIRQVEGQLEKAEKQTSELALGMPKPAGIPADFSEHFRLMTDLLTLAFRADLTRVATFLVTREGTNRSYREIGIADAHHPLTHHKGNPEAMEKVRRINEYHTAELGKWLGRLQATPDGEGGLLDHSLIVYGSGLSDGNRHLHEDLPTLLVGRGGGVRPGRRVTFRRETPMANLHLTLMGLMGVEQGTFGDASGRLDLAS